MRMQARYFCFFTAVFEEVRKEVERCLPQPASAHTPFDWRAHLGRNESERRDALYARVVNSVVVSFQEWTLNALVRPWLTQSATGSGR